MLKIIYNVSPQKNISSDLYTNNNTFDVNDDKKLSKSIFDELNKLLISQEREFNNIATDEKKDDKNFICTNFLINNLLISIVYKDQLIKFNALNDVQNDIQKKKLDKCIIKKKVDRINFSKNTIYDNIDRNQKTNLILKKKISSEKIKYEKNKLFEKNRLTENVNILKNVDLVKTQREFVQKEKNILKINENYEKNIANGKNLIFFQNFKNYKNSLFFLGNTIKIKNFINNINSSQKTYTKELVKSNTKPFLFYDSKNSIEWKKLINQKILLSISNKNNQAEIYLKPECLGSIYIKVHMKNNKATVDFISDHKEVRMFLDNHISFLHDSLKKNAIKLEKVNIFSTLKNKKLKDHKNTYNLNLFQKTFNFQKKNINVENDLIDVYI